MKYTFQTWFLIAYAFGINSKTRNKDGYIKKKMRTQIRKYRQMYKNRNMENGYSKTKNKDACIQKSYWRGKTGTWIQPFLIFTGKMETREKKIKQKFKPKNMRWKSRRELKFENTKE